MSAELEDAEHSENTESDEGARDIVVVFDYQANVVGHNGDHVDDRHDRAHELAATRSSIQTQQVLAREDHDAGSVQAEECYFKRVTTGH